MPSDQKSHPMVAKVSAQANNETTGVHSKPITQKYFACIEEAPDRGNPVLYGLRAHLD
jgi:hypothetical protein